MNRVISFEPVDISDGQKYDFLTMLYHFDVEFTNLTPDLNSISSNRLL